MIVVKLGGSLCYTKKLQYWLVRLGDYAKKQPLIIVPGGGPFADEVRSTQKYHRFDDNHAHHMAILAMAQFGLLIAGICIQCQPFWLSLNQHNYPANLSVWLPDSTLLAEKELAYSWDISADSLALWLAARLAADKLVLVKRAEIDSRSVARLTELNIIDAGFRSLFSNKKIDAQIIAATNPALFNEARLTDKRYNLSLP